MSIEATYGLVYRIADFKEFSQNHLDAFAQVNGYFNVWPFWRELVHSTLGRIGLRAIAIPTLRTAPTSSAPDPGPSISPEGQN